MSLSVNCTIVKPPFPSGPVAAKPYLQILFPRRVYPAFEKREKFLIVGCRKSDMCRASFGNIVYLSLYNRVKSGVVQFFPRYITGIFHRIN